MNIYENILIVLSSLLDEALSLLIFRLIIQPDSERFGWKFYSICVAIYTVICSVLSFCSIPYLLKSILIIWILGACYCWIISEHRIAVTLLLPTMSFAMIYACEASVPFVLERMFPYISYKDIVNTSFSMIFGIVESRSLLYLLWGVIIFLLHRKKQQMHTQFLGTAQWIVLFSAVGLLTSFVIAFQWVANEYPDRLVSIMGIFPFIFVIAIVVFLFLMLSLSTEVERKCRLENELVQKEQQLEQQKAIGSLYEEIRAIQHDLSNHMQIVNALAQRDKDYGVLSYGQAMEQNPALHQGIIRTSVAAIDILLNAKMMTAQKQNIKMKVEIHFPEPLDINIADLCTALFNVLDNALEACMRNTKQENRWISFRLQCTEHFLTAICKNPSEIPLRKGKSGFLSSKSESRYGIGTKQINRVCERYNGFFELHEEDGIVTATCAMALTQKPEKMYHSYIRSPKGEMVDVPEME